MLLPEKSSYHELTMFPDLIFFSKLIFRSTDQTRIHSPPGMNTREEAQVLVDNAQLQQPLLAV